MARDDGFRTMMVHQEMPSRFGVRAGEAVATDEMAEHRVYEFVFIFNPQKARGAVSGSAPPLALAQP